MSGAEVLGIISAIIAIIDATIQVSNAIQDEVGLPPNFKAAATKLPLITKLLDDAERYVESAADEALTSIFTPVLIDCKEKATKLQQLFEKVIQAEGDSRFECYVKAARTIGKGGRVENLMTGILGNLQLLATKFPETVSRRGKENLTKAIEEVSKMEPSLPDGFEDAPSFAHYGSGAQNVNTGSGSQYNNNSTGNQNNGPGNQFIGTNHIVLSTLANEDISIAIKPHFIVPFPRDSDFVARPMIQSWIREQLGGTASRIALIGMGGFGKSQIAIEAAHETQHSHPDKSVFWVHGSTRAAFEESYRSLADKLALPRRHDPKVNILALVRDWLQRDDVASWLLILDNADDLDIFFGHMEELPIASYLPKTSNGKVLVTSRNLNVAEKLTGSHRAITQVTTMGNTEALLLLQKKLSSSFDEDAAAVLVRCLDHIPLAVCQAAAYINRRHISIDSYIKRFQDSDKQRAKLLMHDGGDIRRHESVPHSIAITWQMTFNQIRQESSSAANLLSLLSCFQPQNIPKHMLSKYNDDLQNNDLVEGDSEILEDDADVLFAYSLINASAETHAYEMHSLVQVCTRAWLSDLGHVICWEKLFLRLASENFPSGRFETWHKCQLLLPHINRILDKHPDDNADILDWALLLTNVSWYLIEKGDYNRAMTLAQKSLEARKTLLGADHPSTLTSMANLASTFWKQGRWKEAETLQVQVIEARKAKLGADHPSTLTSMASLASTYMKQGRWKEAETLQVQVMETFKTNLGADYPSTLTSMANLASIFWKQGRWEEAETLFIQVMETFKIKLGADHPFTLISMTNLSSTFWKQGRWEEAETLQVPVIEMIKTRLGADHPDTLTSIANLASIFWNQGRWKEAEMLEVQVMETSKTKLGADHPSTLSSMANLASTYMKQGWWEEAEALQVQVIKTSKMRLGADHPSTLRSMHNLACTLKGLGRLHEALDLMDCCASLRQRILGLQHPDTKSSKKAMELWQ